MDLRMRCASTVCRFADWERATYAGCNSHSSSGDNGHTKGGIHRSTHRTGKSQKKADPRTLEKPKPCQKQGRNLIP